ncbi:2-iminoacetate synthase ThiH [Paenibacillus turpanensis]|uniref:2-iminoacetate synthase ThiH n=1 Tax=Paenibacillus turpanensis TaxID=2689078 RepID=UPI001408C351|nr:2-iminoacetate synthase ThiH [Paenibacillus turpanensis]
MSFYTICEELLQTDYTERQQAVSRSDVLSILQKDRLNSDDFFALLSPVAASCLEEMAQKAHRLTVQHFGRTILLYSPIYVSDYCVNSCVYCSFSVEHDFPRKALTLEEVAREGVALAKTGLQHVLLLTGESPRHSGVTYLVDCISELKECFASVSIEVQPLDEEDYARLIESGVDGLTLYQEVYNKEVYRSLHLKGPKRDYLYRLDAPERACKAGMRTVTLGPLLGLDDWRREVFAAGQHARYLQQRYPATEVGVSFPRMRPHLGGWSPSEAVGDRELVQAMLAMRLYLPRAGITLSTRESAELRNRLLRLGVTKMSAGSCTAVGGYSDPGGSGYGTPQFETSDERSVEQMRNYLLSEGYEPLLTDWPPMLGRDVFDGDEEATGA